MTTLTNDAVTAALAKIVAEKGADYIYPHAVGTCTYSEGEAPSCIVGHVVAALSPEDFEALVEYEQSEGESFPANELEEHSALQFERGRLGDALMAAQDVQDSGGTWGNAQEAYRRVLAGGDYYDAVKSLK